MSTASQLELRLTRLTADTDIQLLNAEGQIIASSTHGGSQSEQIRQALKTGTYFGRVFQFTGDMVYVRFHRPVAEFSSPSLRAPLRADPDSHNAWISFGGADQS